MRPTALVIAVCSRCSAVFLMDPAIWRLALSTIQKVLWALPPSSHVWQICQPICHSTLMMWLGHCIWLAPAELFCAPHYDACFNTMHRNVEDR